MPAWRLGGHGGNVPMFAAGVAWAFTWYLAAVAVLPLAIAAGREAFARRHWGP